MEVSLKRSIDPLTGLNDRSALTDLESSFSCREHPWSLIIIDVDHFKLVNDIYGHLTGDDILSHVGHTIRVNLRKKDHAIRFGGDEFIVILPDTEGNSALDLAQRLLFELGNREFPGGLKISASIGIAQSRTSDSEISALIAMADQALYHAKDTGRGRFFLADDLKIKRDAEPDFSHMVGRREELQSLRDLLDSVLGESARFCTITGYQGIGKSRLVGELLNYCRFKQTDVHITDVNPSAQEDCFLALATAEKALLSLDSEKLTMLRDAVGPVEPATADCLPGFGFRVKKPLKASEESRKGIRSRKDLSRILKKVSEQNPFVMVLENLQWASESSIRYLAEGLSEIPEAKILFLATSRSTDALIHLKPLFSSVPGKKMHLKPLGRSDVRTMLFFALKSPGIPVDVMDYIMHQSGGNSLFLRLLIKWCIDNGSISMGSTDICNWHEPREEMLPDEVKSVIESMLQNHSEDEVKVLKRAALAGGFLDLKLLSQLTGMGEFTLAELMDSFVEDGIINDDGTSYSFVFGVMRSYLLSKISPSLRSILHEKTAATIERDYSKPRGNILSEIAHHYCNSRNRDKAVLYSEKAARTAFAEGLHSDSIHWYREYLDRVTAEENPEAFFHAHINLGILFSITGRSEEAERHMFTALELTEYPVDRCTVYYRLGDNYKRRSMYPDAMRQYDMAVSTGMVIKNKSSVLVNTIVGALLESSFICRLQSRLEEAADKLKQARELMDSVPEGFDPALEGMYYARLADVESQTGTASKALDYYRKGLDICVRHKDLQGEGLILNNMHGLFESSGDYSSMLETLKQVVKIYNRLDDQLGLAIAYYNLAESYTSLNMLDLARRYFQLYIELNSSIENRLGMGYGQLGLGKLFMLEKKYEKAIKYLENASEVFEELECIEMMCDTELARANALVSLGEYEKAESVLETIEKRCTAREFSIAVTHLRGYIQVMTGAGTDRGIFLVESSIMNSEDMTPSDIVLMYGNLYRAYNAAGSPEQAVHSLSNGIQILESTMTRITTESIRNSILSRADIADYLSLCDEIGVAYSL